MPDDDHSTDEMDAVATERTAVAHSPFLTAGSRLRDGRYVLERQLGRGGMAAVWLARDERLGRPVAVKVLSDTLAGDGEYLSRFRREAQVAAGLSHPNLVGIYDFDAADRPYLVMEYVSGGDLGEWLAAGRDCDPERLARELLGALAHIHEAGVLHRDVKPQNVLMGTDGRTRLTDFGIAQPRDATSLTQTGQVLGTASYLAPEVLRGDAPSERSDLYSLGVVLAEAIGSGTSASMLELIDRLRAQDPADRPASAQAAQRELAGFPAGVVGEPTQPLAVRPPPPAEPPAGQQPFEPPEPAPTQRDSGRRRAIAALAIGAIAVALVVGLALGGGDDEPAERGDRAASEQQGGNEGQGGGEPETPPAPPEEDAAPAGTDGVALNNQGKALIDQGRPAEAIPLLEQAVDVLPPDDINYAFALFNLGNALRLAGRPEEAIPILEQRLEIPNQTEVVQAELDAARADAGLDEDSSGPGNGNAFGHDKQDED